ncbi:MAG: FkbM family methyltransferase, partial [Chloroflexota bacterium]
YGTAIENGWRVVDIGAGTGDFTLYAALDHPDTLVYAYEPFPESFAMLEENIRNNHIENVKIFAEAVWSEPGQLTLDFSDGEPLQAPTQGSEMADELKAGQCRVPALALEKVLEQNNLIHLDLLKLDCEGAEFEILSEKSAKTLKRIERIIMEYHDGYQGHHHRELVEFLCEQGFKVRVTPNYVHDKIGYLYAWK